MLHGTSLIWCAHINERLRPTQESNLAPMGKKFGCFNHSTIPPPSFQVAAGQTAPRFLGFRLLFHPSVLDGCEPELRSALHHPHRPRRLFPGVHAEGEFHRAYMW